jgi:hypothetical protein
VNPDISIGVIAKFVALYLATTFLVGILARSALAFLGVEVSTASHLFSIWFAIPTWCAVLWVYWTLARHHPQTYWYTAVLVSVISTLLAVIILSVMRSALLETLGYWRFVQGFFRESVLIMLAALLSRRVVFPKLPQTAASQSSKPTAPNKRLERP